MTYVMWQVFEKHQTRFYVINKLTKEVQSTWSNYIEAKQTMTKLNSVVKVG